MNVYECCSTIQVLVTGGKIERYEATEEELNLAKATVQATLEAIFIPHQFSCFYRSSEQSKKGMERQHIEHRTDNCKNKNMEKKQLLFVRVDILCENNGSLVVSEVEALDPELFLRLSEVCAKRLADAIIRRLHTT